MKHLVRNPFGELDSSVALPPTNWSSTACIKQASETKSSRIHNFAPLQSAVSLRSIRRWLDRRAQAEIP
jgi:hypothetical protein